MKSPQSLRVTHKHVSEENVFKTTKRVFLAEILTQINIISGLEKAKFELNVTSSTLLPMGKIYPVVTL